MLQYFETLTDDSGNSLLGATCVVTNYPAGTPAAIYNTNGIASPVANSTVASDITGQISFYAPDGDYTLTYFYAGTQYKVKSPVQMLDPIGFVAQADAGAANAYVVTSPQVSTGLYVGLKVEFVAANSNTSGCTFNLNNTGAIALNYPGGSAVSPGAIQAGGLYRIEYDGTQWQLFGSQSSPTYPQTAQEVTAGILPTNLGYQAGYVQRYMSSQQLADYLNGTAGVDQTSAFTQAEAVAYVGNGGIMRGTAGIFRMAGAAITLRSGVYLECEGGGTQPYEFNGIFATVPVTQFWKKTGDTAGAIFIMQTSDQIKGAQIRYDLVGGSANGILQVGTSAHVATTDSTYNVRFNDVAIYGPAINTVNPNSQFLQDGTCCALKFMDGSSSNNPPVQRYSCRVSGLSVENCYFGIKAGDNCNQMTCIDVSMHQVYQHIWLNGGSDSVCIENTFTGINFWNSGALPTVDITFAGNPTGTSEAITVPWALQTGEYGVLFSDGEVRLVTLTNGATTATWAVALTGTPTTAAVACQTIVFTLQNGAVDNLFQGISECNGIFSYIDASSNVAGSPNIFVGKWNESVALSSVGSNNIDINYAQPVNASGGSQLLVPLPNSGGPPSAANITFGQGNIVHQSVALGGSLPELNSSTGDLAAADASSRVFARFNATAFAKAIKPGMVAKLTVKMAGTGGGVQDSIAEVEFWYRVTDNTTAAAQFSVISVNQRPASGSYIAGLYFLTGVAAGLGFGLAIVGGIELSTLKTPQLLVDIEIKGSTFGVNAVAMADFAQITWNCVAATANDVTDAISLLTVADTTV